MPPPHANKPLKPHQIQVLQDWVEQGGQYEKHWAFTPPQKTTVPDDVHPIDFFIDAQLSSQGLSRSPKARPETLIRRVYLDLTGLPPTIEQADEYLRDPSTETYERIVDQLLNSRHYGERWARKWLDLARYADTNGFEKDRDRSIWPYRDWVIRSINEDQPFDQFTIEQLAGDMLPNATPEQIIATGFHRNTMLNEEGGIDPLEYRYYAMVDRVGTTGATWLGLTTECAQCHTHKYDPITHEDYFGIMAYMDNADEPDYYTPRAFDASARDKQRLAQARKLLEQLPTQWPQDSDANLPEFESAFESWLAEQQQAIADWQFLTPKHLHSNSPNLKVASESIIRASGDITKHDIYSLKFPAQSTPISAIRLEALPDPELPGFGPGLTYYEGRKGDFFLAEIRISDESETDYPWGSAFHSYAKNQFGNSPVSAELACDGDFQTGWSIAGRFGEKHVAVFNLKEPIPAGTSFQVTMEFGRHFASSLGKFRLSAAHSTSPIRATTLDADELALIPKVDSPKNVDRLKLAFALQAKPLAQQAQRIRQLQRPTLGAPTMVLKERPQRERRITYLRSRGEYTQPQQPIEPRLPDAILNPQTPLPKNRLEFAKWLVSQENPLTARVFVNRQWAAFFGEGIVPTVADFGMQGQPPSHPELLDELAIRVIEMDWSRKQLHRLIVTSETYQQSSKRTGVGDQANAKTLLAFFPRKRLEAEIIRDSSLMASGLLNPKMFGAPVKPPQPAGAAANFSRSTWKSSPGIERFRRSIYTYQKRTAPFAMFTTFDAGSGEACLARRDASNTPLQALTLLNDPMFIEIADGFGKRMQSLEGTTSEKITRGFRWVLTRRPAPDELKMLEDFYRQHSSWPAVARVLLCLDEAINKN